MPPSPAGSRSGSPPPRAPRGRGSWPSMAAPRVARLARSARPRCARLAASREAVGSSRRRIGKGATKTRATFTRCCSPPENVTGESGQSRSGMASRSSMARARRRASSRADAERAQRLRDHVHRGHAGHHAQELAHVAHRPPPHLQNPSRRGGHHVDRLAVVTHEDPAGLRLVVAVDRAEERALARPRRVGEDDALPRPHGEAHAAQHGQPRPALHVQHEGLLHRADLERRLGSARGAARGDPERVHGCSTEETRSWV